MGTPTTNTDTIIYQVYDQERLDLGSKSGALELDLLSYANLELTLSGDITTVSVGDELSADRGAVFSIFVVQGAGTAYDIDWLDSGDFISIYNSAELQPDQTLSSITFYRAFWNGTNYELLTDTQL